MKILPTLRQLRYLVAVAEEGHFRRAAETCAVTQSTLSAGIRELETLLGTALIDRSRQPARLTPVGEEILPRARALLRGAEDLMDAAAAGVAPFTRLIRLGTIPTIGPYLLPRVLPELRVRFPRLTLYLREAQTRQILDLIDQARLDVGLIALPYETGDLEVCILGRERLVLACPAGHPLAAEAEVGGDRLGRESVLLLEDGHCLRDHVLASCPAAGGRANEAFQATGMSTLVQMVAAGLGVTLLPDMAVAMEAARSSGLATVPLSDVGATRDIALVWRAGSVRAEEYRALCAAMRPLVTPEPAALTEPAG
ncbi:MAG: LysR family transcriptional regulator [Rhodospirillales bacterium]|nr:MAG: LysR family transcriptional regulator [Rhodospirillales bacterium]